MKVFVTGAAGFIGMHCAARLLERGDEVIGVDNLNDYYDVRLKEARLAQLSARPNFTFVRLDLADAGETRKLFKQHAPQRVLHLAAQPGVRYSIEHAEPYVQSNLVGFANVLEGCRAARIEHLVYASTSSVYGANKQQPFSVEHPADHPLSLYGATKRANELMAHAYAHLYRMPVTGLRYFTVYGPWGRPDQAPMLFARAIVEGRALNVFNRGKMKRDFTYVDDIAEGTLRVLDRPATPDAMSNAPARVYNIGNHEPVELERFIALLEDALGRKALKNLMPLQPGDVAETWADVESLARDTGFRPKTPIAEGVRRFADWFRSYHGK
jgi:UDP-glucuronate 4-epimerase